MGGATSMMPVVRERARSVSKRLIPLSGLIPLTGRYAAIGCKFPHNIAHAQYYANEGCKTCASVAGLLASFIVVVNGVLVATVRYCC